jgi:hypothetical protein
MSVTKLPNLQNAITFNQLPISHKNINNRNIVDKKLTNLDRMKQYSYSKYVDNKRTNLAPMKQHNYSKAVHNKRTNLAPMKQHTYSIPVDNKLTNLDPMKQHNYFKPNNEWNYQNQYVLGQDRRGAEEYFSEKTVKLISEKVQERLTNDLGRPVKLSDRAITHMMNQIFSYRKSSPREMIPEVIDTLVSGASSEIGIADQNNKLDIWTTFSGVGDKQSHPKIYTRQKRPSSMYMAMRY